MEQSRRAKVRKPGAQSLPRKETPSLPETDPCAQTLQETPESPVPSHRVLTGVAGLMLKFNLLLQQNMF